MLTLLSLIVTANTPSLTARPGSVADRGAGPVRAGWGVDAGTSPVTLRAESSPLALRRSLSPATTEDAPSLQQSHFGASHAETPHSPATDGSRDATTGPSSRYPCVSPRPRLDRFAPAPQSTQARGSVEVPFPGCSPPLSSPPLSSLAGGRAGAYRSPAASRPHRVAEREREEREPAACVVRSGTEVHILVDELLHLELRAATVRSLQAARLRRSLAACRALHTWRANAAAAALSSSVASPFGHLKLQARSTCIYIYIYVCVCVFVYTYIYIYLVQQMVL